MFYIFPPKGTLTDAGWGWGGQQIAKDPKDHNKSQNRIRKIQKDWTKLKKLVSFIFISPGRETLTDVGDMGGKQSQNYPQKYPPEPKTYQIILFKKYILY